MARGQGAGERASVLVEVAVRVARGDAGPEELFGAFVSATVWCERPDGPGFVAMGEPGEGVVAVFSSLAELAGYAAGRPAYRRDGCDWFSTTGHDVLDLLPDGYDLVLDPGSGHALRLCSAGWRRRAVVSVSSPGLSSGSAAAGGDAGGR